MCEAGWASPEPDHELDLAENTFNIDLLIQVMTLDWKKNIM